MMEYRKMDLETWPRREHYAYYTERLKVEFNLTASVDVKQLLDFCHTNGYKFYPALIWLVTKVLNQIENFRMFRDREGNLCVWNSLVPNYTIFHDDDKTFSDCWSEFDADFARGYQNIVTDMEECKNKKGIKVKAGQPGNFYCISAMPWVSFSGYGSRVTNGEPAFFPIITIGKYEKGPETVMMPINLTIAHAVCDGYHAARFFETLQNEINALR